MWLFDFENPSQILQSDAYSMYSVQAFTYSYSYGDDVLALQVHEVQISRPVRRCWWLQWPACNVSLRRKGQRTHRASQLVRLAISIVSRFE